MTVRAVSVCALAVGLLVVSGCATVIDGRTARVKIKSAPSEANVKVQDEEGVVVAETVTPGEVTLKRGRPWLRPAKYQATFEKPGYETTTTPIVTTFNPWTLGNIVVGEGLGAVVDAASGAMWKPKHSTIETALAHSGSPMQGSPYPTEQEPVAPRIHLASAGQSSESSEPQVRNASR